MSRAVHFWVGHLASNQTACFVFPVIQRLRPCSRTLDGVTVGLQQASREGFTCAVFRVALGTRLRLSVDWCFFFPSGMELAALVGCCGVCMRSVCFKPLGALTHSSTDVTTLVILKCFCFENQGNVETSVAAPTMLSILARPSRSSFRNSVLILWSSHSACVSSRFCVSGHSPASPILFFKPNAPKLQAPTVLVGSHCDDPATDVHFCVLKAC